MDAKAERAFFKKISMAIRRPKMKVTDVLKWIAFVLLFILGVFIVLGFAVPAMVKTWQWSLEKPLAQMQNQPVVTDSFKAQEQADQPLVTANASSDVPKVEETKSVLTADVLSLPDSTHYDEKVAYCMTFTTTFGKMGTFYGVYDSNMETCVLGAWESNRIDTSDWAFTLADLKETGDDYVFLNPWKGKINHSAETVYINSQECTPANPVRCSDGTFVFEQGATIRIISEAGNDSSGPFLILTN